MSNTDVLGVDISKATFDVALLANDKVKTKKFNNKNKGFLELIEWLKNKNITTLHVCMEATGNYGDALATYLFELGYTVSVVNPAQIKGFGKSELSRNKTDRADAQLIARFCRAMAPVSWTPKPQHIRELQAWVRRLEALQNMYYQENNRFGVVDVIVKASIKKIMGQLEKEIADIKKTIREHIGAHPDLQAKSALLATIPGVGEATISQILAFVGNVEAFKNAKQLAAFVGLNPTQRQSGTSVRGRTHLSKMGDSNLRKALYLPAMTAKKYNPIIKKFCDNLANGGKPKMLIIGAAMRKLIHIIYGVLKSQKPFDANIAMV
ncbi:MAG TPA: IS110 family transposase [Gammaproteobacteria bacterium]|nr:IS110 family transposase [Gammaproteobacteria bacterium]HRA43438.1 IS110 family transposase [Gammaproteobacteria bacterium]